MDQRGAGGGGASPPKRKNSRGRNRNQNSALEQQAANEGGNPNVEEIDSEDERIESLIRQQLDENDKKHGARFAGVENQLESLNANVAALLEAFHATREREPVKKYSTLEAAMEAAREEELQVAREQIGAQNGFSNVGRNGKPNPHENNLFDKKYRDEARPQYIL